MNAPEGENSFLTTPVRIISTGQFILKPIFPRDQSFDPPQVCFLPVLSSSWAPALLCAELQTPGEPGRPLASLGSAATSRFSVTAASRTKGTRPVFRLAFPRWGQKPRGAISACRLWSSEDATAHVFSHPTVLWPRAFKYSFPVPSTRT